MYGRNTTKAPRLTLRSSHRRLRVGVSHREVPSAWTPPSKDRETPAPVPPKKRR